MRNFYVNLALLVFLAPVLVHGEILATLEVALDRPTGKLAIPVSIDLDNITQFSAEQLQFVEVNEQHNQPIPFQISKSDKRKLHWIIEPKKDFKETRKYQLIHAKTEATPPTAETSFKDGVLTLQDDGRALLSYHYETLEAPEGVDPAYRRSAFIHPLYSPSGHVLTQIQPVDHYHHYGIWNPWTKVEVEGKEVDFWNLAKKQGTVRFSKFASIIDGPIFGEFEAIHEHVIFKDAAPDEVVLNEKQSVRVYQPLDKSYYIVDFTIEYTCPTKNPFLIKEYRYAGFGWRATPVWNNEKNTNVITSEGKNRKNADGSTARWCIVEGVLDEDYGGVIMMSYPANYNHPEPLRIWPLDESGNGEMFANFAPTKNTDWTLNPGHTYTLKYRLLVYDGKGTAEKAEAAWQYFATPPKISVKKIERIKGLTISGVAN